MYYYLLILLLKLFEINVILIDKVIEFFYLQIVNIITKFYEQRHPYDLLPSEYELASSSNAALTLFLMQPILFLFGYCCYCCFNNEPKDMGLELIGDHHEHDE